MRGMEEADVEGALGGEALGSLFVEWGVMGNWGRQELLGYPGGCGWAGEEVLWVPVRCT